MKGSPLARRQALLLIGTLFATGLPAWGGLEEVLGREMDLTRRSSGWIIMVREDGSGSAQYGSSGGDVASFPKGTVDFAALVKVAKSRKLVEPEDAECVIVSIKHFGDTTVYGEGRAMAADWEALCRQIQPHLRAMNPERIDELMTKNPMAKNLPMIPVKKKEPGPARNSKQPASQEK